MIADAPPPIVQRLQDRAGYEAALYGIAVSNTMDYADQAIRVYIRKENCTRLSKRVARCSWSLRIYVRTVVSDEGHPFLAFEQRGMSQYDHGKYTFDLPAKRRGLNDLHR